MTWWSAPCCRRPSCSPTTPRCRCSIPAGAAPRPGGCGAMRSMTGRGADPRIRRQPTSTRRIAAASARPDTWPGSAACCRSTAMLGSSGWRETARTARCSWRSAGRTCVGPSRVLHLDAVAVGRRGARAHPRALRDRGRDPRPPRRTPRPGAPRPKSTHRGRPACLAARPSGPRVRRLRPGESHPLCHPALGRARGVPRRRPRRDGHQRRRARHPAKYLDAQLCAASDYAQSGQRHAEVWCRRHRRTAHKSEVLEEVH